MEQGCIGASGEGGGGEGGGGVRCIDNRADEQRVSNIRNYVCLFSIEIMLLPPYTCSIVPRSAKRTQFTQFSACMQHTLTMHFIYSTKFQSFVRLHRVPCVERPLFPCFGRHSLIHTRTRPHHIRMRLKLNMQPNASPLSCSGTFARIYLFTHKCVRCGIVEAPPHRSHTHTHARIGATLMMNAKFSQHALHLRHILNPHHYSITFVLFGKICRIRGIVKSAVGDCNFSAHAKCHAGSTAVFWNRHFMSHTHYPSSVRRHHKWNCGIASNAYVHMRTHAGRHCKLLNVEG